MSNWLNFSILWMLTGSPVAAAVILLLAYAIADWYTFGFLHGLAHAVADFHRGRRLRLVLLHNPHDRKARADLGEILVSERRYRRAIQIVKPLADENPHDLNALYMLGVALAGLHPCPRPRRDCRRARTLLAEVRDRAAVPEAPGPHLGLARAPFAPADLRGGSLLRDRARRSRAAALHAERARRGRRALEPYAGDFCSASSMR